MEFLDYLKQKKIDAQAFEKAEPDRFREWQELFGEMHPESFTTQKKFLVNDVRRRYLLASDDKI
ncbi:hypothetical protein [Telluribacter humicola]|uniref:hypothetical protein n=1 Tax=Telluribacter humicola TaxID=1720261 RepID=UPI001A95744F|nr:hypothetical protein [Telluribacter humicola]